MTPKNIILVPSAVAALASDPRLAIEFACEALENYEATDFLRDWLDGKDLQPWLNGAEYDQRLVAGEPLSAINHLLH